uniref:Uncharacterized protein n=1 Tax=Anguilla anguilla TaxID=7936 RepID=A0A0E9U088_ANGAN
MSPGFLGLNKWLFLLFCFVSFLKVKTKTRQMPFLTKNPPFSATGGKMISTHPSAMTPVPYQR